ncbi:MAG: hypothetical protein ABI247_15380 [Rhodanobacter sp.]
MTATLASIEAAISKGQQAKTQGEAAVVSRCEVLSSMREAIPSLESRLAHAAGGS